MQVLTRANRQCVRPDSCAEVRGSGGSARATAGGSAAAVRPAAKKRSQRQHHVGADCMLTDQPTRPHSVPNVASGSVRAILSGLQMPA